MTFDISEILLRRKNKLTIKPMDTHHELDEEAQVEIARYVVAITNNVEALGFAFDIEVLKVLMTYTRPVLIAFHDDLIPMLHALRGADVKYKPMYPNFPHQVAEASDAELFVNAIVHYLTAGEWTPEYKSTPRMPLLDVGKKTSLSIGTDDDLADVLLNLCSSKTSLSKRDLEDIRSIFASKPALIRRLPDEIPMKENAAYIARLLMKNDPEGNYQAISKYMRTATDVLRLIVAISDGDLSLASATQFKHMRRPERRLIMKLLAKLGRIDEDLFRYRDEWLRIGEIIHPAEFVGSQYQNVRKHFDVLRNEKKPLFFAGKVETLIADKDVIAASKYLEGRPGEFARRLDKLIRDAKSAADVNYIVNKFASVAESVSTPVLLQVRQAFIERGKEKETRVFFPKGNVARAHVAPNELPEIDDHVLQTVVSVCNRALISNYAKREHMGNVYIDSAMKDYIMPFSQRSASSGNKTLVRGSKVPLNGDANTVRGFIWWTNTEGNRRVDIDLSALIMDEDFGYKGHVSYTRLRDEDFNGYHSGDIVNGGPVDGDGVAEFLDVDIDSVVKNGGRYIVYQVYSFCGIPFCNLPNCRFGWMERNEPNSGEIFEPSTVEMAIKLQTNDITAVPVLFDCVERRFIWMDMNLDIATAVEHSRSRFWMSRPNNLESNLDKVKVVCKAFTDIAKPTMYDVIALNAKARGKIVSEMDEADIIFSPNDSPVFRQDFDDEKPVEIPIVTPYDVDYFMGKLL